MSTLRHELGYGLILPKKVGNLEHLQTLDSIVEMIRMDGIIHLQTLQIWKLPGDF